MSLSALPHVGCSDVVGPYDMLASVCISLTASDMERLLTFLFAVQVFSSLKSLSWYFDHFKIRLFVFLLVNFESSVCILDAIICQICTLQIFPSSL